MHANPLTGAILHILRSNPGGISEYDLIQRLKQEGSDFGESSSDPDVALFRTHFLLMNALYQLQQSLHEEGFGLTISALSIRCYAICDSQANALSDSAADAKLREYYGDLSQLAETSGDDVRDLLNHFWARFLAGDRRVEALAVLDLQVDTDWAAIQRAYRREAALCHPDRGGDAGRFVQVREAYEVLKCCYQG